MATLDELKLLFAEFPRDAISWRAQSLTQAGDKAMALAYIDARDVMDRLDQIVGPDNWQDRYEFHGSRTVCYLSIRVEDEWITKADGAGDSDVEAEKGAISDALKRAAVKWGIGRYLYALPAPWVPCESYERGGKKHWKRWTTDPWSCVRGVAPSTPNTVTGPALVAANQPVKSSAALKREGAWEQVMAELQNDFVDCHSLASLHKLRIIYRQKAIENGWNKAFLETLKNEFDQQEDALKKAETLLAGE